MMWDTSLEKLKELFHSAESSKKVFNRKKLPPTWAHYRRAHATLTIREPFSLQKELVGARVMLNEIYPNGLHLFSSKRLQEWQPVSILVEFPSQFFVQGRVVTCKDIHLTWGLQTREKFPYRAVIEFQFLSPYERIVVKQFCRKISSLLMGNPPEFSPTAQ